MRFTNIRKIMVVSATVAALALPSALRAGTMDTVHQGVDTAQEVDKTVSGDSHATINEGVDTAQDVSKKFDGSTTEQATSAATDAATDAVKNEAVNQGAKALGKALQQRTRRNPPHGIRFPAELAAVHCRT